MHYQGNFSQEVFSWIEADFRHFNALEIENYGGVNFLKAGIAHADAITTVSPTYAKEICTSDFGWGLHGHLSAHSYKLFGILNGVDYEEWDPKIDQFCAKNYTKEDISGKKVCKNDLQKRFSLPQNEKTPLIGFIGRLVEQKGIGLIAGAVQDLLSTMDVQIVLLGNGEKWAHEYFSYLSGRYPDKFRCFLGYSNELAHKIEAGSDMFLMPSLFEPCGLNQMYSQRYGTLPIVRGTGGLEDTVENCQDTTDEGTGFKFYEPSADAVYHTVKWAIDIYQNRYLFEKLRQKAFAKDFSWQKSAKAYIDLYDFALANRKIRRYKS